MNAAFLSGISICIITRNRPQGVARLLAALMPQVGPACEVIVVNDGSHSPDYRAAIAPFGDAILYQPLEKASGIATARNVAVSHAGRDFVVFIDDDCVPPPFWLDWLSATLEAEPALDVIAGVTKPLLPAQPHFFAKVQEAFGLYPNPEKRDGAIRFVTANLAIRHRLLRQVGGFRAFEGGPASGSDSDLSDRVCRLPSARRIDPEWYVYHDVGEPVLSCLRRYWRYGYADGWRTRFDEGCPDSPRAALIRQGRGAFLRHSYRGNLALAQGKIAGRMRQICAALLATLVQAGYLEGIRAAGRAKAPGSDGRHDAGQRL
jgi:mycofactocin glycosyltransferase